MTDTSVVWGEVTSKLTARCTDGNNVDKGWVTPIEHEYDSTEPADMTDDVVCWAVEPVVVCCDGKRGCYGDSVE